MSGHNFESGVLSDEHRLDVVIERIVAIREQLAALECVLAAGLLEIERTQLWKLRATRTPNGAIVAKWKSFEMFCRKELGLNSARVRQWLTIARANALPTVINRGDRNQTE